MRRIRMVAEIESDTSDGAGEPVEFREFEERFTAAMDDDLNTPQAIAAIFDLVREIFKGRDAGLDVSGAVESIRELTGVLGFTLQNPPDRSGISDDDVEQLIQKRKEARDNKRWDDADAVRDQLIEAGISIADADGKTSWWRD